MTTVVAQVNIEERISEALKRYSCIAFGLTLLGIGLIVFGIAGLANYHRNLTGPPYFISGILVGCLELLSALLCIRILQTAREISSDESLKPRLVSYISNQVKLSSASVVISMLGILMALVGGFSKSMSHDQAEGVNKFLAAVIVIGCVITFCIEMFSVYVANSYKHYFDPDDDSNVVAQKQRLYRPGNDGGGGGGGGGGYLEKNLNAYMEDVNDAIIRQQVNHTTRQQSTRRYRQEDSDSTDDQQKSQVEIYTSGQHESIELFVPDDATSADHRDVTKPLLLDKK